MPHDHEIDAGAEATTARARANRRNAARSTGPKSRDGKARAARNAFRHGLSLPVAHDPRFAPRVESLARAIAGCEADEVRLAAARRIAEAELDLLRIREMRDDRLSRPLRPYKVDGSREGSWRRLRITNTFPTWGAPITTTREKIHLEPQPVELWDSVDYFANVLAQLDRYERRAFSRRTHAIRSFDALDATAMATA